MTENFRFEIKTKHYSSLIHDRFGSSIFNTLSECIKAVKFNIVFNVVHRYCDEMSIFLNSLCIALFGCCWMFRSYTLRLVLCFYFHFHFISFIHSLSNIALLMPYYILLINVHIRVYI